MLKRNLLPVVIVPGIVGTTLSLPYLHAMLWWHGFPVYTVSLGLIARWDPSFYTKRVELALRRAYEAHGRPAVLLGYSMGGLVAAHALQEDTGKLPVAALITVATPFRGTSGFARALGKLVPDEFAPSVRAMEKPFGNVENLAAHLRCRGIPFYTFGGSSDWLCHDDGSVLEGNLHRTLPCGHIRLTLVPSVLAHVIYRAATAPGLAVS